MIKPIDVALDIEREEHNAHEDEAHRLMGVDVGEELDDSLICSFTKDGKVIIPGRDDD
ncbi:MAG: hypothetical protein LUO94_02230 [Methylococcaceae bacterium]|nr:hypothetical protein [Methylococcaceae bacterium]